MARDATTRPPNARIATTDDQPELCRPSSLLTATCIGGTWTNRSAQCHRTNSFIDKPGG